MKQRWIWYCCCVGLFWGCALFPKDNYWFRSIECVELQIIVCATDNCVSVLLLLDVRPKMCGL